MIFILDLGTLQTVVPALTLNLLFCFDDLTGLFMGILILALTICFYFLVDYFEFDAHAGSIFILSFLFSQLALVYFCSFDLFVIFFFWEAISLVSFFLVQYWAHRLSSFKAGLKVLVISHIGDIPFFFFFFLLWARFQTTNILDLMALFSVSSFEYIVVGPILMGFNFLGALFLGGAVFLKSAQFIFYPWLLDAMEAPVPISAQLHSSTLVVIGFYLYFRFATLFFVTPSIGPLFICVGLLTALGASFLGFFQEDGKRLLACSTAGQLGYVITTLGLGFFEEAQLLLIFCCTNKAFTFVWFGTLMQRFSGLSDFRFISFSPLLSLGEHAGLCAALANFTIFPGAFSWHVKGLFVKGYALPCYWATALALDLLQLTWLLSSLYMGRLYFGLFLRTLSGGLSGFFCFPSKFQLSFLPLQSFGGFLSLPFLFVACLIFIALLWFEGLIGFPHVDPAWANLEAVGGV